MENQKAAERRIEAEQSQLEEPEASGSFETSDLHTSYSSVQQSSATTSAIEREEPNGIDQDEISTSPLQEHSGRDIKFGDLPHPRKDKRSGSEGPRN